MTEHWVIIMTTKAYLMIMPVFERCIMVYHFLEAHPFFLKKNHDTVILSFSLKNTHQIS